MYQHKLSFSLLLTASLFLSLPAKAEVSCGTPPTCAELGYTKTTASCSGIPTIKCPFDKSKVFCGEPQPKIYTPAVGDIKYSLKSYNHDGWLQCDGSQYSTTTYSQLYNVIGTNFCRVYTSRTHTGTTGKCISGKFAVPDYRGFFLRGYKASNSSAIDYHSGWSTVSNALYYKGSYLRYGGSSGGVDDSLYIPEYERLPNIGGELGPMDDSVSVYNGAFYRAWGANYDLDNGGNFGTSVAGFQASRSNPIYDGGHVVPANYGAHIYIYAGD